MKLSLLSWRFKMCLLSLSNGGWCFILFAHKKLCSGDMFSVRCQPIDHDSVVDFSSLCESRSSRLVFCPLIEWPLLALNILSLKGVWPAIIAISLKSSFLSLLLLISINTLLIVSLLNIVVNSRAAFSKCLLLLCCLTFCFSSYGIVGHIGIEISLIRKINDRPWH